MTDAILSARGLAKNFGGLWALDGVDLDIKRGEMTLMIGPNGSGKTTFLNVVTGVYKPERGRVYYNGGDITGLPPHVIYGLGVVRTWQIPQPFQKLTVLENLLAADKGNPGEGAFSSLIRHSWIGHEEQAVERAFRILKILKLNDLWDQPAYKLSGGQMKLLEAGRALMSGAQVILMDEPAAGINPVLAHEVLGHLRKLNKETGLTFLLIEHRLDLALQYVDHVCAMHLGKVIADGEPEAVLNDPLVIESYLGR